MSASQIAKPVCKNPGAVLAVAAYAAFLATFNETFLNVALTPIMQDLGIGAATVQWVSTAYMLMAAIMVPVTGFLYRKVPTKRLMSCAVGMLLIGSVVGFLAPNFPVLLIGRVVQAVGTGMMVPICMNATLAAAPRNKMGTYMGIVSAMTTLGPAFGPIVAGVLLSVANWHALFALFAALVAVALIAVVAILPNLGRLTNPTLDVVSTCLVSLALVGLLYGLSTVFSGNRVVAVVCMLVGVAALVAFLLRQRRIPEPLIDVRPFGNAGFNIGVLLVIVGLMTVFSMNIILPLLMQGALGLDALGAALTLLPACVLSCVLAPVAGKVYDRFGIRAMAVGGTVLMAVFAFGLSRLGADATSFAIVALYAPVIVGASVVIGPCQSFALSRLKPELYPHGVTIVSMSFQIAGCVGSSLFVGVLSGVQASCADELGAAGATVAGFSAAALVACVVGVLGVVLAIAAAVIEVRAKRCEQPAAASSAAGAKADAPVSTDVPAQAGNADAAAAPSVLASAPSAPLAHVGSISEVMLPDVYSVSTEASAFDALECMVANRTSGLPVLDADGRLAGFVVDGDILRTLTGGAAQKVDFSYILALWQTRAELPERIAELRDVPVMEIATKRVVSVELEAGLNRACELLADTRIKKLPVTQAGHVVGMLGRSDLLRYMVSSSAPVSVER